MKIIKPQNIGYMGACLHRHKAPSHVITGILGFDLTDCRSFSLDADLRALVDEVVGPSGFWDLWMPKTRGEYLVWGSAVSATPVRELSVSVQCGPLKKQLNVFGESHWYPSLLGWNASPPSPFQSLPVDWHHAYGGKGFVSNPLGVGFANEEKVSKGEPAALPAVYYPGEKQVRLNQKVEPASFQPRNPAWDPVQARGSFGGTWLASIHPAMPADFDWSYYNWAPLDQRLREGYWKGDEAIRIEGMCVDQPVMQCNLPGVRMRCFSMAAPESVLREHPMVLDTVGLLPGVLKGFLVFRAELADAGIDASLLSGVMLGAEWAGRPKSDEHYRNVFDLRTDPDVGMDYLDANHQLMPDPDVEAAQAEARTQSAALAQAAFEAQQRAAKRRVAAATAVGAGIAFSVPTEQAVAAPLINAVDASMNLRAQSLKTSRFLGVQAPAMLKPLNSVEAPLQESSFDPQATSAMPEVLAPEAAQSAEALFGSDALPASEAIGEPEQQAQQGEDTVIPGGGVASMVSQLGELANQLDGSSGSLGEVIQSWSDRQFPGAGTVGDAAPGLGLFDAMGDDPKARSEMANQLRAAMQEIERGAKMQEEFANSADPVGSALAQVPPSMQASMRGVLEKMLNPASAPDVGSALPLHFKNLLGAGGASGSLLESLAELDPDNGPLVEDLLASLDSGPQTAKLAELMRSGEALGLSPKLMTPQNVNGLAAWMLGHSDAQNPLAKALNEAISASGDGESLEAILASARATVKMPALDQWAKEVSLATVDSAQQDADIAASIEQVLAQSSQGSEFSLEQLLGIVKQPDSDVAPGAATQPPLEDALLADVALADKEPSENSAAQAKDEVSFPTDAAASLAPEAPVQQHESATEEGKGQEQPAFARAGKASPLGVQGDDVLSSAAAAGLTSRALLSKEFLAKMDSLRQRGQESLSEMRRLGFAELVTPAQRTASEKVELEQEVRQARAKGGALKGLDLAGLDLSGVDLHAMDLQGTCFEYTNLSGADLSGANCTQATFAGANLSQAKFQDGLFQWTNLKGATAHASQWQGADLSDSLLSMALFTQANFERVTLDRCEAHSCIFEQANLSQSRCEGGDFLEVDLRRANLQGAVWTKCQLFESRLDGLNARSAALVECIFSGAQGAGVNFSGANLERCNLIRAKLPYLQAPDAQAPETSWVECDLSHAVLQRTLLTDAIFIEANLVHADLSSASCRGAVFTAANLTEADLSKAQLLESSLRRAKASGANFSYANLEGAELTGADLDRCDLTGAQVIATVLAKPSHA